MSGYIPRGDAEFNAMLDNFVTYAGANLSNLGLVQGDRCHRDARTVPCGER